MPTSSTFKLPPIGTTKIHHEVILKRININYQLNENRMDKKRFYKWVTRLG